jgi:hypothetical protein
VLELTDCVRYRPEHEPVADRPWAPRWWALVFGSPRMLPEGLSVRGLQRVFRLPAAVRRQVADALRLGVAA